MTSVLLVTVDSLRADHVGCYGYERPTTPTLDDLAEGACVYGQTFAHACATRPSFPAILTSSYPLMYGGYERISENRTLVSEVFDEAGYRTGGFHSNGYLNAEFGYDRGFDRFDDSMTDPSFLARFRQYVKTNLDNDGLPYRFLERLYQAGEKQAGADVGSAYVDADELTDRAIGWLRQADADSDREFLWVHYMDVHHPYVPPAEHQRAFREEVIDDRRAMWLRRKFLEEPDAITDEELDTIVDLYDAEIRFADAEFDRLLDAVDERWDDYVVAFTADHGEEFRDHGGFSHGTTFHDEVMHVPLVIDDGTHEGRVDALVGLLDLAPTLVDAAGLDQPPNFYGHSLREIHEGQWPRESVLGDWSPDGRGEDDRRYAYRDLEWKYIRREEDDSEELFHLPEDPRERENLIEERSDAAEELRAAVDEHARRVDATGEDLGDVQMDEEVKEQLRDLGYAE